MLSPIGQSSRGINPEADPAQEAQEQTSAMERAAQQRQQNPSIQVEMGLKHLDDPSVPISSEDRMSMIEPLLQAKHFGPGGKGSYQGSGAQGSVYMPGTGGSQAAYGQKLLQNGVGKAAGSVVNAGVSAAGDVVKSGWKSLLSGIIGM